MIPNDQRNLEACRTRRSTIRPTALVADLLTGDLSVIEVLKVR